MTEDTDLHRSLGRMEGKLDALTESLAAHTEQMTKTLDDHDTRIGDLETTKWWTMGAAAVVAWFAATFLDLKTLLAKAL